MRNFRVTVNGSTYDVAVEELGASPGPGAAAEQNYAPPMPAGQAPPSALVPGPTQAYAPRPVSAAPPGPPPSGPGYQVVCPMPGSVLGIPVSIGERVRANQVVILLEAMKMENEVCTPVSGVVSAISVTKGDMVNSGDVLIVVAEE